MKARFPGNNIAYAYWHSEAERREKAGQRQIQCKSCELWYFPKWRLDKREHERRCFLVYEWNRQNRMQGLASRELGPGRGGV